jgi:hypothetical protein
VYQRAAVARLPGPGGGHVAANRSDSSTPVPTRALARARGGRVAPDVRGLHEPPNPALHSPVGAADSARPAHRGNSDAPANPDRR